LEFSSACVVSFLARVLSVYLKDKFNVCYFSMALSAVVQLLPGLLILSFSPNCAFPCCFTLPIYITEYHYCLQMCQVDVSYANPMSQNFWLPLSHELSCRVQQTVTTESQTLDISKL
jgi:hypothetical protein